VIALVHDHTALVKVVVCTAEAAARSSANKNLKKSSEKK
jgi:hypothetical protein